MRIEANRFALNAIPDDSFEYETTNLTIREVSASYRVPEEVIQLKNFYHEHSKNDTRHM